MIETIKSFIALLIATTIVTMGSGLLGLSACIGRLKLAGKVEDQVPFIPLPKTSPIVGVLDPRRMPEGHLNEEDTN